VAEITVQIQGNESKMILDGAGMYMMDGAFLTDYGIAFHVVLLYDACFKGLQSCAIIQANVRS